MKTSAEKTSRLDRVGGPQLDPEGGNLVEGGGDALHLAAGSLGTGVTGFWTTHLRPWERAMLAEGRVLLVGPSLVTDLVGSVPCPPPMRCN